VSCAALILMIVTRPTPHRPKSHSFLDPGPRLPARYHPPVSAACPRLESTRLSVASFLRSPHARPPRPGRAASALPKSPPSSLAKPPQNQKNHSETSPKPKKSRPARPILPAAKRYPWIRRRTRRRCWARTRRR
jgi:hypothetical protein